MSILKLFNYFKILFFAKFSFSIPKNREIIVFDDTSIEQLKPIIKNFNYFILETRFENLKNIYITKKIICSTFQNVKIGFFNSYLLSLIEQVNPQLVITFIDNSHKFSNFAKIKKDDHKFVAIQNGARYEHKIANLLKKKKNKCRVRKILYSLFFLFWRK